MAEPFDWAKFHLQALTTEADYRIKIASARASLAAAWVEVARKRVQLAAEVAEQRRMADAYRDFLRARHSALAAERRARMRSKLAHERLRDLQAFPAASSPTEIRNGWIAYKYFLRRLPVSAAIQLEATPIAESLRKENKPLSPEAREELSPSLALMVETTKRHTEELQKELTMLIERSDDIRTANWQTVKLDTSWVS